MTKKKKAAKKRAPTRRKKTPDLRARLEAIAGSEDFEHDSLELVIELEEAPLDEATQLPAVLGFMEEHPDVDFGGPGALVHFVEQFDGPGYEAALLASLERRPTFITTMLLNRLINGTKGAKRRAALIAAMRATATHPRVPAGTVQHVQEYLERLAAL